MPGDLPRACKKGPEALSPLPTAAEDGVLTEFNCSSIHWHREIDTHKKHVSIWVLLQEALIQRETSRKAYWGGGVSDNGEDTTCALQDKTTVSQTPCLALSVLRG